MKPIARLAVMGALLFCASAQAQFLNMLATTPLSRFNDDDNKLFMAAIDKALTEGSDGVPMTWSNPKTPANGVITPQRSFVADGMKCRDLLIANTFRTLKGEAEHTFCQNSAGQWKLQS